MTTETNTPEQTAEETMQNPILTEQEAFEQLPPEVQGAIGQLERMGRMFVVRLPDVITKIDGRPVRQKRYLSMNGRDMRVFHTRKHAEQTLANYQQLMIARAAMRMELQEQDQKILLESIDEMQAKVNEAPRAEITPEQQEGWPIPEDYDPSKVTGGMFTGQGVDEDVARQATEIGVKHSLTPDVGNATSAEV